MERFPTDIDYIPGDSEVHDFEGQVQLFALAMQSLQEPNQRFHNWEEHIVESYHEAMRLCDLCEAHGAPVNRLMVAFIVLGHDSGHGHSLISPDAWKPYGSKEGYSVHLASGVARSMGYDEEFIEGLGVGIMSTKLGEPCPTTESKVARRADMANTKGPFLGFFVKFNKLAKENHEADPSQESEIKIAIDQACKIVESYWTTADLSLGPWDNIHEVIVKVKNNLDRLRQTGEDFVKKI